MSLKEILVACAELARDGGVGALASVARRHGSLPMSATAKMLVRPDGSRIGTVGGGCLEAEIAERSLDVIERRMPVITEHSLNSEIAGDYGLACGGTAIMFIEPVYPHPVLEAFYSESARTLERGDRALAATALDWSRGPLKALLCDGKLTGADVPLLRNSFGTFRADHEAHRLDEVAFVEPISGAARLVVFGGGHVGASILQAATFAGWRVTIVDDREDYASADKHPLAEHAVVCDFHAISESILFDAATYVVVATRGHQHDALVVEQLASRPLRYLGMLGSRRKVALTWKMLESQGVPADLLSRIHAPVGLSIGADTPQEIAISVVAEMISVRRAGSRRRGGISSAAHDNSMAG